GPQILEQLVIGSALAFGVAAVFAAVEMAGSLVDLSIGFSLAQVINPTLNTSSTALSQVYSLAATMVFLSTGAHEVLIAGVVRSFTAIPLDQSPQIGAMTSLVEHQMAQVVPIALQIAAPVLGTLLLVDVGFAFLARLVPSLNPFAAQFSVKILAGLFAVSVSLPLTISIVGNRLADVLSTSGFIPGGP
ncbi:MAG: flagellar biosynthesis protein FliR, partial [Gaiellales bacterium]|nr:flagellar biosynthesis protein FliR [Gaiellales bacterium]